MPKQTEEESSPREALRALMDALSSLFTRTGGSYIVIGRTFDGSILLRSRMSVVQQQEFDRAVHEELLLTWARYQQLASGSMQEPIIDLHWCVLSLSILVGLAVNSDDAELGVLGMQILDRAGDVGNDITRKLFPFLLRKQEPDIVIVSE